MDGKLNTESKENFAGVDQGEEQKRIDSDIQSSEHYITCEGDNTLPETFSFNVSILSSTFPCVSIDKREILSLDINDHKRSYARIQITLFKYSQTSSEEERLEREPEGTVRANQKKDEITYEGRDNLPELTSTNVSVLSAPVSYVSIDK